MKAVSIALSVTIISLCLTTLTTLTPLSANAAPNRAFDASACWPPPQIVKNPPVFIKKERPAFTPIAGGSVPDAKSCIAMLESDGVCRIGSLVVVDVGDTILRAGRCERDPKGTESYALTGNTYNQVFGKVQDLPDYQDRYQTFVFWTNFKETQSAGVPVGQTQGCPLAWHSELGHPYNQGAIMNIKGIGQSYNPAPPGMVLHAIINFWSIQDWTDDELLDSVERTRPLNILSHETEHDVCCYVRNKDPQTGHIRADLIGHQGAHWSLYVNTYGQLMYGGNWREEGNGTFYSIAPANGTRPMDLYLWGLIPPAQAPPFYFIDTESQQCTPKNQTVEAIKIDCADLKVGAGNCEDDIDLCLKRFNLCLEPPYFRTISGACEPLDNAVTHSPTGIRAKGAKKFVTVEDVIAANGSRFPDYKNSYKLNTQLFILLVEKPDALTQKTVDRLDAVRRAFSRHFYNVTHNMMRNSNSWDGRVDAPLWEWGGLPEYAGDIEFEGWHGLNLKQKFVLNKGKLLLQLKDATSGIVHDNLAIAAKHFDSLQVVITLPELKDNAGEPKLLSGKFVLENTNGKAKIAFPVRADGKEHKVTVHPQHKLFKKGTCRKCDGVCEQCVAVCRALGEKDPQTGKRAEHWYDSCSARNKPEKLKDGPCKTDQGQSACGPYCFGQGTDQEGWYDSCESSLRGTFTKLTVIPVASDDAGKLAGPVVIDRVDLFKAEINLDKDLEKKDAEKDYDGDGLTNAYDNCPTVANPGQTDSNDDQKGDACDDFDADGIVNAEDNCPTVVNSLQQDDDQDGIGNACDQNFSQDSGCSVGSTVGSPRKGMPSAHAGALFPLVAIFLLLVLSINRKRN